MTFDYQQQQSSKSFSSLIWFHLYDSDTGLPYKGTTATSVSLPPKTVIDQFRKAVKAEYSDSHLKGISPSDLLVFQNKQSFDKRDAAVEKGFPLDEDSPVDGLGKSKRDALIVVVRATNASNLDFISIPDKLKQLGVDFSIRDINYLLNNDTAKYSLLKSPQLLPDEARQAKSSLYYAFSESGVVLVAKVYLGNKECFLREVEINQTLEHKNLVKFVKTFSIHSRHVIIMPFFPRSVADWLNQDPKIPFPAVKIIAQSCYDALCYLHSKSFCFVDLKPSNIMLQNNEPSYAILVDYGATVQIGDPVIEFTESYCLDADKSTANQNLDWICLGATLAQIVGFNISCIKRAADLVDEVNRSTKDEYLKKLIVSCLQTPSSSKIESALKELIA